MAAEVLDLRSLTPGLRLRIRRVVLGVTQGELARMLGEHRPRVSEAELGQGTCQKTARMQARLEATLNHLETTREASAATDERPAGAH